MFFTPLQNAAGTVRRRARTRVWSRTVRLLGFVALLVQSLAVQTHVHLPWLEHADAPLASLGAGVPADDARSHDGTPRHGDADHCPLWQELLHAGAFTMPGAALSLFVATVWHAPLVPGRAVLAVSAVSHNWQGRAPPRR